MKGNQIILSIFVLLILGISIVWINRESRQIKVNEGREQKGVDLRVMTVTNGENTDAPDSLRLKFRGKNSGNEDLNF